MQEVASDQASAWPYDRNLFASENGTLAADGGFLCRIPPYPLCWVRGLSLLFFRPPQSIGRLGFPRKSRFRTVLNPKEMWCATRAMTAIKRPGVVVAVRIECLGASEFANSSHEPLGVRSSLNRRSRFYKSKQRPTLRGRTSS